jgi:hypothetical protein
MHKSARDLLLAFVLALVPSSAQAQDSSVRFPQDIVFKSPFAGYPQVAVVKIEMPPGPAGRWLIERLPLSSPISGTKT